MSSFDESRAYEDAMGHLAGKVVYAVDSAIILAIGLIEFYTDPYASLERGVSEKTDYATALRNLDYGPHADFTIGHGVKRVTVCSSLSRSHTSQRTRCYSCLSLIPHRYQISPTYIMIRTILTKPHRIDFP